MAIHPTAIIDKTAQLDPTVEVGAYAVIEGDVKIGAGTRLYPHAYVARYATLGQRCQIHPFAVVGHLPQDLAFDGSPSYAKIGDDTIIREGATVHRGTLPESVTVVGNRCFIMSTGHVGHNCVVGDDVKIVNGALLAGHVRVGDKAFISGNTGIHQFVRIGELAMLAGGLRIINDVPPFMLAGPPGVLGPNVVGLRRAGLTAAERHEIRECHRLLFRDGLRFHDAVWQVSALVKTEPGRRLAAFLQEPSKRGFPRLKGRRGLVDLETDGESAET